jgi:hypothetical protein
MFTALNPLSRGSGRTRVRNWWICGGGCRTDEVGVDDVTVTRRAVIDFDGGGCFSEGVQAWSTKRNVPVARTITNCERTQSCIRFRIVNVSIRRSEHGLFLKAPNERTDSKDEARSFESSTPAVDFPCRGGADKADSVWRKDTGDAGRWNQ